MDIYNDPLMKLIRENNRYEAEKYAEFLKDNNVYYDIKDSTGYSAISLLISDILSEQKKEDEWVPLLAHLVIMRGATNTQALMPIESNGEPILNTAFKKGKIATAYWILCGGADANRMSPDGTTSLMCLAMGEEQERIKFIPKLAGKISPALGEFKNENGFTAADYAKQYSIGEEFIFTMEGLGLKKIGTHTKKP